MPTGRPSARQWAQEPQTQAPRALGDSGAQKQSPGGPGRCTAHQPGGSGLTQEAQAWGPARDPATPGLRSRARRVAQTRRDRPAAAGVGGGGRAAPARAVTHAAGAEKGTEKVSGGRRRGTLREGECKVLTVSALSYLRAAARTREATASFPPRRAFFFFLSV